MTQSKWSRIFGAKRHASFNTRLYRNFPRVDFDYLAIPKHGDFISSTPMPVNSHCYGRRECLVDDCVVREGLDEAQLA